jgi:hypothetical protein
MFVFIVFISSYTASFVGACVVSPFQDGQYDVLSIPHPTAVCRLVILVFIVFIAVATAQFWIAFVDAVFNVESTTGLLFKSP